MTQATARWLAIPEVAARLELHEATIYRLIESGDLTAEEKAIGFTRRRALRIHEDTLAEFIRERTDGAA